MAANTTPIFTNAPNVQQSQVSVANTAFDGTGTIVTAWSSGSNGSILSKIVVTVPGTSVADMIALFWNDGSNTRLYQQIKVTAATPSSSVACFRYEYCPSTPEVYPTGWTLKACTYVGQTTDILCIGANY